MGPEHDDISVQLSLVFDELDDYLIIVSLPDHRYTAIIEFQAE